MWLSSELAGRFAGVGYWWVEIGVTAAEMPARSDDCRKISAANPAQLVSPALLKWKVPVGASASSTSRSVMVISAPARSAALVGEPCWSSTTVSVSRVAPTRSMVFTKLLP